MHHGPNPEKVSEEFQDKLDIIEEEITRNNREFAKLLLSSLTATTQAELTLKAKLLRKIGVQAPTENKKSKKTPPKAPLNDSPPFHYLPTPAYKQHVRNEQALSQRIDQEADYIGSHVNKYGSS